jgi:hypothetical protein
MTDIIITLLFFIALGLIARTRQPSCSNCGVRIEEGADDLCEGCWRGW